MPRVQQERQAGGHNEGQHHPLASRRVGPVAQILGAGAVDGGHVVGSRASHALVVGVFVWDVSASTHNPGLPVNLLHGFAAQGGLVFVLQMLQRLLFAAVHLANGVRLEGIAAAGIELAVAVVAHQGSGHLYAAEHA